jgi:hypothetical protein
VAAVLAIVFLVVGYNWRAFRNLATQEAMDSAQLARNIAEGKGFTTLFVRPFSIFLLKKHNQAKGDKAWSEDAGRLKGMHPDLANPPVYPVLLAGLMKVLPFNYDASTTSPFWSNNGRFWRYQPDFLIAVFNQLIFLGTVVLVFLLARRLFDPAVAWLSAVVFFGTELFWRFSVSGLSTMLLLLIFGGLAWAMVLLDEEIREPKRGPSAPVGFAALAGALVGLGALTRYGFGWLILPVFTFLLVFGGQRRVTLALVALLSFAVLLGPWVARNYALSGTPFGTATYTALENTFLFPEYKLSRSLDPDLSRTILAAYWHKLMGNGSRILQSDLPKMGGSWVSAFFLVGLLVAFRNPTTGRLRVFLVACIATFAFAQALGQTQLSEDSPEINSENLLVIVAPLVLVYGVSLFFLLLDQLVLPAFEARFLVIGLFGFLTCLPLLFVFLPPQRYPVAFPPYAPPIIQTVGGWLNEKELIMSDIPWATAWYGRRQSVWLTLRALPDPKDPTLKEDFAVINDYQKPINGLYLTHQTLNRRFIEGLMGANQSWGHFVLQILVRREVPDPFPLTRLPVRTPEDLEQSIYGGRLILMDWERWRKRS